MRIVKAYHWKKEDSVALTIYSAELVIGIYEKKYPNDTRPRDATEAAKKWLAEPTEANRTRAANAANAAAHAAANAAYAAAKKKLTASIDKWMIKRIKILEPYE